jgi:hypothetical protein
MTSGAATRSAYHPLAPCAPPPPPPRRDDAEPGFDVAIGRVPRA